MNLFKSLKYFNFLYYGLFGILFLIYLIDDGQRIMEQEPTQLQLQGTY